MARYSKANCFSGSNHTIDSNQNGNYVNIAELLSEYDSILKIHFAQYGNLGAHSLNLVGKKALKEDDEDNQFYNQMDPFLFIHHFFGTQNTLSVK